MTKAERPTMPPLPEFARGNWAEVSDVLSFDGICIIVGPGGPDKLTRENFIRGAAKMLYGDRADGIVEHWRSVASPPVAEPKRGVEEILERWIADLGASNVPSLVEALRLYREEKRSDHGYIEKLKADRAELDKAALDLEAELAALKPRVEKAIHYARGLNQLPDGGTAATEWIVEILEGRDT